MRRRLAVLVLAALGAGAPLHAQTGVLLQGFYWNVHPGDVSNGSATGGVWWDSLRVLAPTIAGAGIQTVWVPSPVKGAGGRYSMGYDLTDYYDFGEQPQKGSTRTRFGNRLQLVNMMSALHSAGLRVMVDAVLNHRDGGNSQSADACGFGTTPYNVFNVRSNRFPANATSFNPTPTGGGASNCSTADPYYAAYFGQDLGYFNNTNSTIDAGWYHGPHNLGHVGDSLVVWGRYLMNTMGFDEVRLDAVKHIEPGFLAPWLSELTTGTQPFAVGEFFGNTGEIKSYADQVNSFNTTYGAAGAGGTNANLAMFDFGLRYALKDLADGGGGFDMSRLNAEGLRFNGVDASRVVTFVENHDFDRTGYIGATCTEAGAIPYGGGCVKLATDSGHSPVVNRKHLAYSYLMAAEGRPSVFYKDFFWYRLGDELAWQIALRTAFASGTSAQMSFLSPGGGSFNTSDFWALRRRGDGTTRTGMVLAMNDRNDGVVQGTYVDTPGSAGGGVAAWQNIELRDYSDAFLFQSSRVFGDGRAYVQANAGNYAWYAPTGLYPRPPSVPASRFTMTATPGGKLHYVVLRAEDAGNLRVGGRGLQAGDEVAACTGASCAGIAGIARNGLATRWDGVHDLLLEVLGNEGDVQGSERYEVGQPLRLLVHAAAENITVPVTSLTAAPAGTAFTFDALRPASRGAASFGMTTNAADLYSVGGVSLVTAMQTAALPVELVTFTGTSDGPTARLAWTTASETNNAGFAVEQQVGALWQQVGFVAGHGTTVEQQRYTFAVPGLASGTHRFRLRQVDFDGAVHFSPVVELAIEEAQGLRLRVQGRTLTLHASTPQRVRADLFNILGRRVATLFDAELSRAQPLTLPEGLPSGVYVVRATSARGSVTRSVVLP